MKTILNKLKVFFCNHDYIEIEDKEKDDLLKERLKNDKTIKSYSKLRNHICLKCGDTAIFRGDRHYI